MLEMKMRRKVLVLMFVVCVMGPELSRAKQPDVRSEIEKLGSSDPTERATAAKTLGNIGNRDAVEPLISLLKDENRQVRENAVTALRWIRDPRAVDSLIAMLKDEDGNVRDAAARALGWFRDPRGAEPLIAAFENWPSMSSVRSSLKDIGLPAVEPLNAALKNGNPAVRTMAARTLGDIEDPGAVEPLISSLKDENRDVRENAATALRWIGDPRAVEPLIAALKDEDKIVQSKAAGALKAITGRDLGKGYEAWKKWWDKKEEDLP